jgi:hypothetical protein
MLWYNRNVGIIPALKYCVTTINLYQNFLPHMGFVNKYPMYTETSVVHTVPRTVLYIDMSVAGSISSSSNIRL